MPLRLKRSVSSSTATFAPATRATGQVVAAKCIARAFLSVGSCHVRGVSAAHVRPHLELERLQKFDEVVFFRGCEVRFEQSVVMVDDLRQIREPPVVVEASLHANEEAA